MRQLVVTVGAPGCGKSTWIEQMGLSPFTLAPDNIRMMVQNPVMNPDGRTTITMGNEKLVWDTLFTLLEERMKRGDFTVVDATHSKQSMITQYKELCQKYRYRCIVVDFSYISVEKVLAQNKMRPAHKHVPEDYILNVVERLKREKIAPGWTKVVSPQEFEKVAYFKPIDFSQWKKIHHIGDIHGCHDVLEQFLADGLKDDELYIFTGDYIDRGPQNYKTLKLLLYLAFVTKEDGTKKAAPNVVFLEGNHERWIWQWANDEIDEKTSRIFRNETMPQLEKPFNHVYTVAGTEPAEGFWNRLFGRMKEVTNDIHIVDKNALENFKKDVRQFYRILRQCMYYTYGEKTVFVSHGGFPQIPEKMEHLATHTYINGVGKYEDDIDAAWTEQTKEDMYQVHGHRNIYRLPVEGSSRSFNLEGQVESGGFLRIATLDENGWHTQELKNDNFIVRKVAKAPAIAEDKLTPELLIEYLSNHKYIRKNQLTESIASFNFTKEAFSDKKWDDINVKARGLFINTNTNEIVSRSYNKFFNVNERSFTKISALADNLVFPVKAYSKANGFLGIVGYDTENDDLFISSKSETRGQFAEWFKELFYKTFDENALNWIKNFLKTQNLSMTFEVILTELDPHMIKYDSNHLVLLDLVKRDVVYSKLPYNVVWETAQLLGVDCKKEVKVFENWLDFYTWYKDVSKDFGIEEEGYVIEDASGFMTKLKLPFYNFWKQMRGVKDQIASGRQVNTSALYSVRHNKVYNFMNSMDKEELKTLNIIQVRDKMAVQE
jgi:predicted kinase